MKFFKRAFIAALSVTMIFAASMFAACDKTPETADENLLLEEELLPTPPEEEEKSDVVETPDYELYIEDASRFSANVLITKREGLFNSSSASAQAVFNLDDAAADVVIASENGYTYAFMRDYKLFKAQSDDEITDWKNSDTALEYRGDLFELILSNIGNAEKIFTDEVIQAIKSAVGGANRRVDVSWLLNNAATADCLTVEEGRATVDFNKLLNNYVSLLTNKISLLDENTTLGDILKSADAQTLLSPLLSFTTAEEIYEWFTDYEISVPEPEESATAYEYFLAVTEPYMEYSFKDIVELYNRLSGKNLSPHFVTAAVNLVCATIKSFIGDRYILIPVNNGESSYLLTISDVKSVFVYDEQFTLTSCEQSLTVTRSGSQGYILELQQTFNFGAETAALADISDCTVNYPTEE